MQTKKLSPDLEKKKRLPAFLILMFTFLISPGFIVSVKAVDVNINSPWAFTTLDGSGLDADGLANGTFTVNGNLTITGTGSITGNVGGGSSMNFQVSGDLIMDIGARITGDVSGSSAVGNAILINVGGAMLLHGDGVGGARITSNQTAGSCNGGKGGAITLSVTNEFTTETGSVISANAKCSGGAIVITASIVDIDGLVESNGLISGTGATQAPGGGPITIIANCSLTVNDRGKVSSLGVDPGADLVHLEACNVYVFGLVQSTGTGHGVPNSPKTKLVPPFRPDKPATSTAGVEIWGNDIIIDRTLPHNGEVKADLTVGAGSRSWIDIMANNSILILGRTSGNFAVHANNGGAGNIGGIITLKSNNVASATRRAIQSNGAFGGSGGPVTVHATQLVTLNDAAMEAKGVSNSGGNIQVRSFNADIANNAGTNFNVSGPVPGVVGLTECGATPFVGTKVPAPNPVPSTGVCGTSPSFQPYVVLPAANCAAENCREEQECPCIVCSDLVVVVDQNVTINFNTAIPTYTGDPDLLPYFSYDKSGATPDKWKAIFNMGADKLLVKTGATITVSTVNGYAPGIEINEDCEIEIEPGGRILVVSSNKDAGDIVVLSAGHIIVNGEVRNQVTGTLGLPGAITATSKCGNFYEGQRGLVQILGVDGGGNTISIVTCAPDCDPSPNGGDITINGLVKSFAAAHTPPLTLNRPNIRVASFNGAVTINANTVEPLYDEFSVGGGLYDIYGGLLSWVSNNVNPGKVEVQAKLDVTVNGHGTDPTGPVRTSFGAIASKATASNAPGGLIDVRSLEGNIVGNDRAFDVAGRNLLATNFAHIDLGAKLNITLNRLGANNTFNPVVTAAGYGVGDRGGLNTLRSYTGSITVGANALVTAAVPVGFGSEQGSNQFSYCTSLTINGTVTPAAVLSVACVPEAPDALFTDCLNLDNVAGARYTKSLVTTSRLMAPGKTSSLQNYPNPFTQRTTISYTLANDGYVSIKVFNSLGKEVANLVSTQKAAGQYQLEWNAAGFTAGVYYVRLNTNNYSSVNKLVLVK